MVSKRINKIIDNQGCYEAQANKDIEKAKEDIEKENKEVEDELRRNLGV